MSSSRTDLFKISAKRGRACCNSIASREAGGMNAHQIRAKATNGAWCSTLKSTVLSLEGCLTWCTNRSNRAQHRSRLILEVTQSLSQASGRSIDFQHSLYNFSGCSPTMKASIWANHGSNIFGVSNNLHLTELIAILRKPCLQGIASFSAIMNPTTFAIIQIEASNAVDRTNC